MNFLLHLIILVASIIRIAKADSSSSSSSSKSKSSKSSKSSSGDDGCKSNVVDITLDFDPRADPGNVDVALYGCTNSKRAIILAPGGNVPRSSYSMVAQYLANEGYLIAVIEHLVSFGPIQVIFASPVDISNTIKMIGANYGEPDDIILLGHSFGAVSTWFAFTGFCPTCITTQLFDFLGEHENVKGAVGFGGSLYSEMTGGWTEGVTNKVVPFHLFIGTGDSISFNTDPAGDNIAQGTYDRLVMTKVMTIVKDLDHYSIANELQPRPDDVPSTLRREKQIELVAGMIVLFVEELLEGEESSNEIQYEFCDEFIDEFNDAIADCQEDVPSTLF